MRRSAKFLAALLAFLCWSGCVAAQTVSILPNAMQQFVDGNGAPYAGGHVYMYVPNTTTPKATYQTPLGTSPNANPITLDANGRAVIWGSGEYRQVLQDLYGNVVWDQLTYASPLATGSSATLLWYGTATGTANAITLASPSGFVAGDGQTIGFIANATNTGSATINASGYGSILVDKNSSGGLITLSGGEIVTGNLYSATYSAAKNVFVLNNPIGTQVSTSVAAFLPAGQPDGSTDNSVAFQTAANSMCASASNGGVIYVPAPTTAAQYVAHDINNTCGNTWQGVGSSGIGSANQTAVALIQRGGTSVNYAGATSYFMRWQVPGFPAFPSGGHLNGGGITGMSLFDGTSTATALVVEGTQDWKATYLILNGAYNGVYMKGDEFPVTSHISMYATRKKNYEIVGTIEGQTQSGATCTNTNNDCSTRSDAWFGEYLTNIDNLQTNTVFTITGFVATTTLSHTNGEGPLNGLVMSCPSGLNVNMAMCPTFGRFNDLQFEYYHGLGVSLTDSLNNYFDHLYSVGDASSSTSNAFYESTINYATSAVPPGVTQITNSQLFAVWGDCANFSGTLWDIEIYSTRMNGCNSGNISANVITFAGSITHIKVSGNQLGDVDNYGGSHIPARGVSLGTGITWADIWDNNFDGLGISVSPVLSTSSNPGTIHVHDNTGPGSVAPTIGSCGTGASFANIAKDDEMVITVGSGNPTSCVITFTFPMYAIPACIFAPSPGANASGLSVSASANGVTLSGASLSGSYALFCRAP